MSLAGRTRTLVAGLNPVFLFFGPMFQKEVCVAGRKKLTYWARGGYALILLAFTGLVFVGMSSEITSQSPSMRLQQMQGLAPTLTLIMTIFQFAVLSLIAPTLTAGAISQERRSRSLSALMTTPMTGLQIVLGKLTSSIVQLMILSMLSLPLLFSLRVFGGADAGVILAGSLITLTVGILGASLALMFSIWHKRAAPAVVFAVFSLALIQVAPITIAFAVAGYRGSGQPWLFIGTCAPAAMIAIADNLTGGFMGIGQFAHVIWPMNAAYNLLMAIVVIAYSSYFVRKTMLEDMGVMALATPTQDGAESPEPKARIKRRKQKIHKKISKTREIWDNPVLWREVQQPAFAGAVAPIKMPGWLMLLVGLLGAFLAIVLIQTLYMDSPSIGGIFGICVLLLFSSFGIITGLAGMTKKNTLPATQWLAYGFVFLMIVYLYLEVGLNHYGMNVAISLIAMLGLLFQASVVSTSAVSGERESSTWQTLLTTPMSARQILYGKFTGSLRRLWIIVLVPVVHLTLASMAHSVHPVIIPIQLMLMLGPAVMLTGAGLLLSLVLPKTVMATVGNLGLAVFLWIMLIVGVAAIGGLFGMFDAKLEQILQAVFLINPVSNTLVSIGVTYIGYGSGWQLDLADIPPDLSMEPWPYIWVQVGIFAGYLLAGFGAVELAIRLFRRFSGRVA